MANFLNNYIKEKKEPYSIAIIVTWFGKLPEHFPVWLKGAEYNSSIDFFLFSDQQIFCRARNIHFHHTTLKETIRQYERKLSEKIDIDYPYKLHDFRAFFGVLYAEYIKKYAYWGYCDIDLILGDLRRFLTKQRLDFYQRFYEQGHLSIFKNDYYDTHLFELKGSIYSYEEIFKNKAYAGYDGALGLNRICRKNYVKWYKEVDYADFSIRFPHRLEARHGLKNYPIQIFLWRKGRAYQVYKDEGKWKKKELAYMHWQGMKPVVFGSVDGAEIISFDKNRNIVALLSEDFSLKHLARENRALSKVGRDFWTVGYFLKNIIEFITAPIYQKKILMKQQFFMFLDNKVNYDK